MTSARRIGAPDAKNRGVLLDTAEQLMIEEGYAAVTSRRVASEAGLKPQLVHYYFRRYRWRIRDWAGHRTAAQRRRYRCRHPRPQNPRRWACLLRRCHQPLAGRCRVGGDSPAAGPGHNSGQRRGFGRVQAVQQHHLRGLAASDRRQPQWGFPHDPGGAARHGGGGMGPNRQHLIVEHAFGHSVYDPLCGGEVRRQRTHQGIGARVRAQRYHVNAVPPGFIDTPMLRNAAAQGHLGDIEQNIARTPVRRIGKPEDIAAACAFLVSEEAGYITGQILGVNGGRNT